MDNVLSRGTGKEEPPGAFSPQGQQSTLRPGRRWVWLRERGFLEYLVLFHTLETHHFVFAPYIRAVLRSRTKQLRKRAVAGIEGSGGFQEDLDWLSPLDGL
jgi:hypothetical protein